ncbi:site-2 protease family protein [Fluviicola taffensis]|uniref:Peptidase M50 n=1 Tax=Fluviicola taffensis (strain DSM 16823 / NCIMB 13979 / RW262) TaxID=755732 RepID=F2IER0_FLUTR|nr:site-2 protease family protein [Fluviicola taffensis]AEA45627.1 peptidase M50 [Fluviicola taffensis DSM 16823]
MENDFNSLYPPKPFLENEPVRQGHMAVTVFSLLLFALSFVLFFGDELFFLIQLLAVLIIHEGGHYLFMKLYKYENVRMLFIPLMGAFVHGKKESYRQRESLMVVLAGPIPGIIIGVVLWILGFNWEIGWMVETSMLFFVVNILNLLPILPLDGGRMLNILFFEKIELFQVIFSFISSLSLIAIGYFMEWYIILIFGFLMGFQVRNLHRRYLIHKGLKEDDVNFNSTYDNLSDRSYHFVKNQVLEHTPGLRRFVENMEGEDTKTVVANEVKNMLVPPMEQDITRFMKFLVILAWILAIFGPIYLMWSQGLFKNISDAV